jgi:N-acetylglucosamine kinase-like BadF-type ATPase
MPFYLAIDSGGTKADLLLADDTRELARVRTGTIKRMRTDATTAANNLTTALAQLEAQTGVSMRSVTRTCIGTAGETVPLVTDFLRAELSARVSGDLILLGDVEIALDAAFPGQPGILVLAGTGSNVAGRDASGKVNTAGGWGPALADQGSGHRIGQQALRALFLAIDHGISSTLLPAVLQAWNLRPAPEGIDDLVAEANRIPSPDVSRLTELVLRCALAGDATAAAVLQREGEDLAALVRILIHRLLKTAPELGVNPAWLPPIAFAGSIMERVHPVREALVHAVQQEFPAVQTLPGVVDPIQGALYRARRGF